MKQKVNDCNEQRSWTTKHVGKRAAHVHRPDRCRALWL